ncbi:MAG TPA: hypothetical protein DDZ81_19170 [Acetobacteraceae bacterium]|jgi:Flp pilus assembly protein TadD|nr:hypothetical protein [Acetobacteraceae bacterium]
MEKCMRLVFPTLAFALSALVLGGCGLTQDPQQAEAQGPLQVADVAMASGAPELALRLADLELERKPGSVAAMRARADALYAMSSLDEAEAAYRHLLQLNPDDTAARIGLGRTLLRSDPAGAEATFLAVLDRQPENQPALNDLGIARDLQGHHEDAQKAYRQALAVAPDDTGTRTNLEMSLGLSQDGMNAVPVKQAMATVPDAPAEPQGPIVFKANRSFAADGHTPPPSRVAAALPAIIHPQPHTVPETPSEPGLTTAVARIELPEMTPGSPDPIEPAAVVVEQAPQSTPDRPIAAMPEPALTPDLPPVVAHTPEQPAATVTGAVVPDSAPTTPVAQSRPKTETAVAAPSPQPAPGEYYVQLGALDSAARAQVEWERVRVRLPDLFANLTPAVHQAEVNNRTFWRLRTGSFTSHGDASAFCARLRQAGANCWTPATRG